MESWCWVCWASALLLLGLAWALWVGVFRKMKIVKAIIKKKEFMYLQYVGDYDKQLGIEFEQISKEVQNDEITRKAYQAAGSIAIGLYYDDPSRVVNREECRAVIGFTFEAQNDEDRDHIMKTFRKMDYRHGQFKETHCLFSSFPIRFPRFVAFMLSPSRFYPNAFRFIKQDEEISKAIKEWKVKNKCGVEMYDKSNIYYHFPIENFEDFDLINHPAPELKEVKKNK